MMNNKQTIKRHCFLKIVVCFVLLLGALAQAFQVPPRIRTTSAPYVSSLSLHRGFPVSTTRTTGVVLLALDEELPTFKKDIEDSDASSSNTENKKSPKKTGDNLVQRFDSFGQSLKPRAQEIDAKAASAAQTTTTKARILLKAKAALFWMLYMGYRGYRGFFVILPAVFREVYQKMETAVDFRVLDDDKASTTSAAVDGGKDTNPETGKLRWRTRITVSLLAGIVTFTYVLGGLARVILKFTKTILSTSSLSGSFSAAANEVEDNEGRLMRLNKNYKDSNGAGNVNGSSQNKDLGF